MSALLPLFLRLGGRRVLVVGGGAMAALRVRQLGESGARVEVVAPDVLAEIMPLAAAVHRRRFRGDDLDGAWLAVAAATPEVNRMVARAAEARRIFVNAVDDPVSASAYAGAVLRRGGVIIAVSTEGRAPALAGLIREAIEALLPDELDEWVACAEALRSRWKRNGVPVEVRRLLLLEALDELYRARSPRSPAKRTEGGEQQAGEGTQP